MPSKEIVCPYCANQYSINHSKTYDLERKYPQISIVAVKYTDLTEKRHVIEDAQNIVSFSRES